MLKVIDIWTTSRGKETGAEIFRLMDRNRGHISRAETLRYHAIIAAGFQETLSDCPEKQRIEEIRAQTPSCRCRLQIAVASLI